MIPTFQPRKPPHRRARADAPPSVPAASVTVESVQILDAATLVWTFSSNLTAVPANCPQLETNDGAGSGWVAPVATEIYNEPNQLVAGYAGVAFSGSSQWRVLSEPAGLSFADGALVVPESGSVTA